MAEKSEGGRPMVSGSKIREHREALKASTAGRQGSQSWLATQIGAHFTSVSDWERGINQPSSRHLRAIADTLGVRIEDLYAGDDDKESRVVGDHHAMLAALAVALEPFLPDKQTVSA